jgi:phosphoglycerate kinase
MELPSVRDVDLEGKTVIMRVDYNLPMDEKGEITDHTRISTTMKTLNHILERDGKIVLVTHLGRPEAREEKLRMNRVADKLSKLMEKPIKKLDGCVEGNVCEEIKKMKPGEIIMLENVRFYDGEKSKDDAKRDEFAKSLAKHADFYVNEAFAVSHRDHASVTGIPKHIPGCCGLSFLREVNMINKIIKKPERPYIAIVAGAKKEKMMAVEKLLPKVDKILLGGIMANTFLKARGLEIGDSKCDDNLLDEAKRLLEIGGGKIILPTDSMVENCADAEQFPVEEVRKGMRILDIGPETIVNYKNILRGAKTIIWAGPLGMFEKKPYEKGTLYIASFISGLDAKTLVGGGDTIAAMQKLNMMERMTHISTGGGAFIEYITKDRFPGVEAIKESCRCHGHFSK